MICLTHFRVRQIVKALRRRRTNLTLRFVKKLYNKMTMIGSSGTFYEVIKEI